MKVFKRCILHVDPEMKRMWERRWTLVKVTWWWIRLGGHTWSLAVWFSELGCQYWRNNLHKRNRRRNRGWHHTLGQWFHPLKHSLRRGRWWRGTQGTRGRTWLGPPHCLTPKTKVLKTVQFLPNKQKSLIHKVKNTVWGGFCWALVLYSACFKVIRSLKGVLVSTKICNLTP